MTVNTFLVLYDTSLIAQLLLTCLCCGPNSTRVVLPRTIAIDNLSLSFWAQVSVKHQKSLLILMNRTYFKSFCKTKFTTRSQAVSTTLIVLKYGFKTVRAIH